jgi:hypothetical protein
MVMNDLGRRVYDNRDVEELLMREYGSIPKGDWSAYEFLKNEMGLKERVDENVYRERYELILQVLEI